MKSCIKIDSPANNKVQKGQRMVVSVQFIDFDVAIITPEGRLGLAREYFEAHENLFESVDEERMTKIYNSCREEIAQVARESLKEKPVERLGVIGLFPLRIQTAIIILKDSIPSCIQRARAINILRIPMPSFVQNAFCLEDREKNKITILAALVMVVFFIYSHLYLPLNIRK